MVLRCLNYFRPFRPYVRAAVYTLQLQVLAYLLALISMNRYEKGKRQKREWKHEKNELFGFERKFILKKTFLRWRQIIFEPRLGWFELKFLTVTFSFTPTRVVREYHTVRLLVIRGAILLSSPLGYVRLRVCCSSKITSKICAHKSEKLMIQIRR